MLNILEGFDLAAMGHNLRITCKDRVYAQSLLRLRAFQTLTSTRMPLDRLLDKGYASELVCLYRYDPKSESNPELFAQVYESEETTHFLW